LVFGFGFWLNGFFFTNFLISGLDQHGTTGHSVPGFVWEKNNYFLVTVDFPYKLFCFLISFFSILVGFRLNPTKIEKFGKNVVYPKGNSPYGLWLIASGAQRLAKAPSLAGRPKAHPQPPNADPHALFDVLVLDGGRD